MTNWCALLLILTSSWEAQREHFAPPMSVCDAVRNWRKLNGQVIRVRGVYYFEFRAAASDPCWKSKGRPPILHLEVASSLADWVIDDAYERMPYERRPEVVIEGRFESKPGFQQLRGPKGWTGNGYGQFGLFPAKLTVIRSSRFQPDKP